MLKPATFYSIINLKADEKDADHTAQKQQLINLRNKYQKLIQDFKTDVLEKGIQGIKLEISLASASLDENISLFKALLSNQCINKDHKNKQNADNEIAYQSIEINFASLYNDSTYRLLELFTKSLLKGTLSEELTSSLPLPKIKAYTPLTTSYIKQKLKSNLNFDDNEQIHYTLEIIPAIFCKTDFLELKTLIGKVEVKANKSKDSVENPNKISSVKIFPCLIQSTKDLINSLKNPIKELQGLTFNYSDNEGLEINNSQDLENLIELASHFDTITGKKAKIGTPQQHQEIKIKNSYYPNRFTEIIEMILLIWDTNPDIHIICAGFNGASLEEIGDFYSKLIKTLSEKDLPDTPESKQAIENKNLVSRPELTDKISIATRNNNFHEIQEFFKYSSI